MECMGVDILAMNYFTKWPEVYAVPYQSAATTARILVDEAGKYGPLSTWCSARHQSSDKLLSRAWNTL